MIDVTGPFEAFRRRYEQAAPPIDPEQIPALVGRQAAWDEVLAAAEAAAPHGFLIYWSSDVTPLMALADDEGQWEVSHPAGVHVVGRVTVGGSGD